MFGGAAVGVDSSNLVTSVFESYRHCAAPEAIPAANLSAVSVYPAVLPGAAGLDQHAPRSSPDVSRGVPRSSPDTRVMPGSSPDTPTKSPSRLGVPCAASREESRGPAPAGPAVPSTADTKGHPSLPARDAGAGGSVRESWLGQSRVLSHPLALDGVLQGYMPLRRTRGTCLVVVSGPSLWPFAARALGFEIAAIAAPSSTWVGAFSALMAEVEPRAELIELDRRRGASRPGST